MPLRYEDPKVELTMILAPYYLVVTSQTSRMFVATELNTVQFTRPFLIPLSNYLI